MKIGSPRGAGRPFKDKYINKRGGVSLWGGGLLGFPG